MTVYNRIKRKIIRHFCDTFVVNYYSQQLCYNENKKRFAYLLKQTDYGLQHKNNNIWIMWLQGEENAPEIVKACISSVRTHFPDYQIHILTDETIEEYLSDLPNYIFEKYRCGIISRTHFSDIARAYLLFHFGGYWFDATCYVTGTSIFDIIKQEPFFAFKHIDLDRSFNGLLSSSWFLWSHTNNPILGKTLDLLYAYWREHDTLDDYFLFHIMLKLSAEVYHNEWEQIPVYNNVSPHILQFELDHKYSPERWDALLSFSDIHKLNRYIDGSKDDLNSNYDFIINTWRRA